MVTSGGGSLVYMDGVETCSEAVAIWPLAAHGMEGPCSVPANPLT